MNELGIAQRCPIRLRADATRVVTQMFFPGQELIGGSESRNARTVARVMALTEGEVSATLAELFDRFGDRHQDLTLTFDASASAVLKLAPPDYVFSDQRRQLLGATFTHEFSIEGAAICNPSLIAHFDQTGVENGALRTIMSYRTIGEGHRSAISFRTGMIAASGDICFDDPAPFPIISSAAPMLFSRDTFHQILAETGDDGDTAGSALATLSDEFSQSELEEAVSNLAGQAATRLNAAAVALHLLDVGKLCYARTCSPSIDLSRRVLWPTVLQESRGMEDARFLKFEGDSSTAYLATYTAYDGVNVMQRLLITDNFCSFTSSPLTGVGSQNKGLAIFPRKVGGSYMALSRHDRESNSISTSDSLNHWPNAVPIQDATETWELVQLGNCGAPIELEEGWLVLTHGVGPMRTYGIGALLLDLEDPSRVIGRLRLPLLAPNAEERDGYVPNVVYSCGSLLHRDTLYIPYGISDNSIGCATVGLNDLLERLLH
jgi:predicted GH43/DUF377 family glycosyl hydrolase